MLAVVAITVHPLPSAPILSQPSSETEPEVDEQCILDVLFDLIVGMADAVG